MTTSFANFYRGKRVLVTGHTGFKGGWLTEWLKLLGAQVAGFSLPPSTRPNLFDTIALDRGMTSIFGDVRDRNAIAEVFADHQPEILIHHAAQSSSARSFRDPVETYAVNVTGSVHVLDEARHIRSLRAVVVTSNQPAYERSAGQDQRTVREEDSAPQTPLASSRSCVESVTAAYRSSFFSDLRSAALASLQSGEVIGGGDWSEDRLIPEVVRAISADEPLVIGRPDFVYRSEHVLESARACLMLAKRLYEEGQGFAEAWNVAAIGDGITVHEIARRILGLWGKGELVVRPSPGWTEKTEKPTNEHGARKRLGLESWLTLEQSLEWTVEWYREYYRDPASAWRVTQEQLQRYMEMGD